MDIREKKTKRSIYNAFLELRSKKPLEKITVKELSEAAEISKATFYLHYKDIYDLSDQLQSDLLAGIINVTSSEPDMFLNDPPQAYRILQNAFQSYQSLIDILFSGTQEAILPLSLEKEIKEATFRLHPDLKNDVQVNATLTFLIMGGYYAYMHNSKKFPTDKVSKAVANLLSRYEND